MIFEKNLDVPTIYSQASGVVKIATDLESDAQAWLWHSPTV
jgi:hypothetical protein